jgi:hypothetical protein
VIKNEKDKCQMDTPSPYKRAQSCSGKNLQTIVEYNNRSFASIITGDDLYEPKRKINNKILETKGSQRHCITKRIMSVKKVMYVIFLTKQGPAVQIAVPKEKSVNATYYKGKVLYKLKKYFKNRRPATGFHDVRLLHDNAPSHKAKLYENI